MNSIESVTGNIVDIFQDRIYFGEITITNGRISAIEEKGEQSSDALFILPGFVDAHVHIESSLLAPSQFARLAVVHGTVGTVSDPHEIANVLGVSGVEFMLDDAAKVPFHFAFGAPSCVPATDFESAGAILGPDEVKQLLKRDDIFYLAEMMNFPGVLYEDASVMKKIACAKEIGKPIDGHAPGLRGEDAKKYASAGMSTDHECFTFEEAEEKLQYGMKILIREGSAAKNFEALAPLMKDHAEQMMFCTDDCHPDMLVRGHINEHVRRAVGNGIPLFDALRIASKNPVEHYGLPCGLLRIGDSADFIEVKNLTEFPIQRTVIQGMEVARDEESFILSHRVRTPNNFNCEAIAPENLLHRSDKEEVSVRVIEIVPGELISKEGKATLQVEDGGVQADPEGDVLKLTVVNRYTQAPPAIAYVRGFKMPHGAIASSVAHDSHNIVAAGTNDDLLAQAVNLIVENEGGLALVGKDGGEVLPLPVAGLMSPGDGYQVAKQYTEMDAKAKAMGSTLPAPFMTLSFLALLVIPELKLSDKGLFDGRSFEFVPVEL